MPLTLETCIAALTEAGDESRSADLHSKFGEGQYIGVAPQELEDLARSWRQDIGFPDRLEIAQSLWDSGLFDAQLMAAKLLTQARIKDDAAIWDQICVWIESAPTWAHVDALAAAGARRISIDLERMDKVHDLASSETALHRRAALALSLPLAKLAHPTKEEVSAIDDVLYWLTYALDDADKDVSRKADAWLKALSKHDVKRAKMVRRVVASRKETE